MFPSNHSGRGALSPKGTLERVVVSWAWEISRFRSFKVLSPLSGGAANASTHRPLLVSFHIGVVLPGTWAINGDAFPLSGSELVTSAPCTVHCFVVSWAWSTYHTSPEEAFLAVTNNGRRALLPQPCRPVLARSWVCRDVFIQNSLSLLISDL